MNQMSKIIEVDLIMLQVVCGVFEIIVEEMGYVFYWMLFFLIIWESQDLGVGLFDIDFNMFCELELMLMYIGLIFGYLCGIVEMLEDGEWYEGDVVVYNYFYYGLFYIFDLVIVVLVFFQGWLVGFVGNIVYYVDIGVVILGLIIDVFDVYVEGMLFVGIKFYCKGELNNVMWNYICCNFCVVGQLVVDIEVQIVLVCLGVCCFVELFEKYGEKMIFGVVNQLMDYVECMICQCISEILDGDYMVEGWLDDDGCNCDQCLKVKVMVCVCGDEVEVDLIGLVDQIFMVYNVFFEGLIKVVVYVGFCKLLLDVVILDVWVLLNEGFFCLIKVMVLLGLIFNFCVFVLVEVCFIQCNCMIDLIICVLVLVMLEQVIVGFLVLISFVVYFGVWFLGDYWVFFEVNEGVYGGWLCSDGLDSIDNLMVNICNNLLEDLVMYILMICDCYELCDDVFLGVGQFWGGIGVVKVQWVLMLVFIIYEFECYIDVFWGIFGGQDGVVGCCMISNLFRFGQEQEMYFKFLGLLVGVDDVMIYYSLNGGGYGNLLNCVFCKVLEDVLDGFCIFKDVCEVYGVVIDFEVEMVDLVIIEKLCFVMQCQD